MTTTTTTDHQTQAATVADTIPAGSAVLAVFKAPAWATDTGQYDNTWTHERQATNGLAFLIQRDLTWVSDEPGLDGQCRVVRCAAEVQLDTESTSDVLSLQRARQFATTEGDVPGISNTDEVRAAVVELLAAYDGIQRDETDRHLSVWALRSLSKLIKRNPGMPVPSIRPGHVSFSLSTDPGAAAAETGVIKEAFGDEWVTHCSGRNGGEQRVQRWCGQVVATYRDFDPR